LTNTTWLIIRSFSTPGGILYGVRIWSRNHFYTRAEPLSPKGQGLPDCENDNSDNDVPYGAPGIFDQPSPGVETSSSKRDTPDSDIDDIENDVPQGSGLFDTPLAVSERSRNQLQMSVPKQS